MHVGAMGVWADPAHLPKCEMGRLVFGTPSVDERVGFCTTSTKRRAEDLGE